MSSNGVQILERHLPSSLDSYHAYIEEVLQRLRDLGWKKKDLVGVEIALEESISNAIRHGNNEDGSKQVHVECRLGPQRFWAKVCDEGTGYEPDSVPDCRSSENLKRPGGRGLTLIRGFMNVVEHSQRGCCITMEKVIGAPDPEEE